MGGDLIRRFRYRPYGELTAVEDGAGAAVPPAEPLEAWHLFQGLWRDSLAPAASTTPWTDRPVLDYVRARTYRPDLGRFNQRDPNEQALILFDALAMNGCGRSANWQSESMSVFLW